MGEGYGGWADIRGGGPVKTEDDPLDPSPPAMQRESLAAIRHLERVVLAAAPMQGIVLRYGSVYGPGASDDFVGLFRNRRGAAPGRGGGGGAVLLHPPPSAPARPPPARPTPPPPHPLPP